MKREEVKELFPDASEDTITALMNKVNAEISPLKQNLKSAEQERDTAIADLATSQAKASDLEQQLTDATSKLEAGMTAEEKLAALEKQAKDREIEFTMKSNRLDAQAIFVEAGCFDADEVTELVNQVTSEDAEKTKANAQKIVETVQKQRAAVEQATKDALLKGNPKPAGGGGAGDGVPTTIKDFLELPESEQLALKEANPGLLSQLK